MADERIPPPPEPSRLALTAAYLLEYWAKQGVTPRCEAVIDGLRNGAEKLEQHEDAGNG